DRRQGPRRRGRRQSGVAARQADADALRQGGRLLRLVGGPPAAVRPGGPDEAGPADRHLAQRDEAARRWPGLRRLPPRRAEVKKPFEPQRHSPEAQRHGEDKDREQEKIKSNQATAAATVPLALLKSLVLSAFLFSVPLCLCGSNSLSSL